MMVNGQYFRYPLRLTGKLSFAADITGSALYEALSFRLLLNFEYECMACAEAGNEWVGSDPGRHAREHQMGLDYAHVLLKKHPEMTPAIIEGGKPRFFPLMTQQERDELDELARNN